MDRLTNTSVGLRPEQLDWLDEQLASNSQIMRNALDDYMEKVERTKP